MSRKNIALAVTLTLVLGISSPLSAMPRDGGRGLDPIQRVVKLIKQISGYMIKDVPVIPTTESVDWYEYNTQNITGWPTEDDPYAQPAAYNVPDWGIVAAHLESK